MNRDRLFVGSCFSLISTSVCFAVIGAIMGPLKDQFALTNEEVGYIGGAALWGFTLSIFALGPLVDALGMKNLMRFAMVCHLAGALIMILAGGDAAYWMLFGGALILALGNGTVEAACNPLVATLYPDEKTKKLNQFHVWFPGGIVLGGVACYALDQLGITDWRIKVALIIAPTIVYGLLFAGQKFPATERVQSGLSFQDMLRGAFLSPLFIILLACMCITASVELGPNRWIPSVYGILVLSYISGLMAVLRFFAGPVVHKLSPTGILVASAVLSGAGLYWFSFAESTVMTYASATVFAIGICYFWPTMLGVVSERVPRSGALGLAVMGGTGMLMVGLVTTPQMGRIGDEIGHGQLDETQVRLVLQRAVDEFPAAAADGTPAVQEDSDKAVTAAQEVLAQDDGLPVGGTAKALRAVIGSSPEAEVEEESEDNTVRTAAKKVLDPADNYGGRMSFRYVAPFAAIIIVVFGIIYLRDRASGGYTVEKLDGGAGD